MFDFIKKNKEKKADIEKIKKAYLLFYAEGKFNEIERFANFCRDKHNKCKNYIEEVFKYIASNTVCISNDDLKKANELMDLWSKYDKVSYDKYRKNLRNEIIKTVKDIKLPYVRDYLSNCKSYMKKNINSVTSGDLAYCNSYIYEIENILASTIKDLCDDRYTVLNVNDYLVEKNYFIRRIYQYELEIVRVLEKSDGKKYSDLIKQINKIFNVDVKSSAESSDVDNKLSESLRNLTLKDLIDKSNNVFLLFKKFKL